LRPVRAGARGRRGTAGKSRRPRPWTTTARCRPKSRGCGAAGASRVVPAKRAGLTRRALAFDDFHSEEARGAGHRKAFDEFHGYFKDRVT
jgi:hypothetical protein